MKSLVLCALFFIATTSAGVVKRQFQFQQQYPQQFPQQYPGQGFQISTPAPAVTQAPNVTPGAVTTTTLAPDTLDCIRLCPRTQEYNYVCGTNNVTYDNRSHLGCAQRCGIVTAVRRPGKC